ncbi:MAG TPA: DUF742 domain-containing protein [Actinomycetota bacterium]
MASQGRTHSGRGESGRSGSDGDRDPAAVRPYALTGGRTRPGQLDLDLAIETLVSTTAQGEAAWPHLTPEGRKIVVLCRDLVSVAEISARLEVPLGVAQVLIADLAVEGRVRLHPPRRPGSGNRPDLALLERVLTGLRSL